MKKFAIVLAAASLILSCTACSSKDPEGTYVGKNGLCLTFTNDGRVQASATSTANEEVQAIVSLAMLTKNDKGIWQYTNNELTFTILGQTQIATVEGNEITTTDGGIFVKGGNE